MSKMTKQNIIDMQERRDRRLHKVEQQIIEVLKPLEPEVRLRILKAVAILHGLDLDEIMRNGSSHDEC